MLEQTSKDAYVLELSVGDLRFQSTSFGAAERGLWCPDCLLPSAVRLKVRAAAADGAVWTVGTMVVCTACEATILPETTHE